jgi:hypothetical protein
MSWNSEIITLQVARAERYCSMMMAHLALALARLALAAVRRSVGWYQQKQESKLTQLHRCTRYCCIEQRWGFQWSRHEGVTLSIFGTRTECDRTYGDHFDSRRWWVCRMGVCIDLAYNWLSSAVLYTSFVDNCLAIICNRLRIILDPIHSKIRSAKSVKES